MVEAISYGLLCALSLIKINLLGRVAGSPGRRVAGSPGRRVAGSRNLCPRVDHEHICMAAPPGPSILSL